MRSPRGPRLAAWMLERVLPASHRDAVLGDLAEEYGIRAQSASIPTATRWYRRQVWRSIPPGLWLGIRHAAWLATVGVAIAMYLAAGIIEFAGVAAMARLLGTDAVAPSAPNVIVGLASMLLGGYLAARIRPGAATILATIVMLVVLTLIVTVPDSAPLWYGLTFLIVGPVAAMAGGTLGRRRRPSRT